MDAKVLLWVLAILLVTKCGNRAPETVTLDFEKDLIPEGIAVDAKAGRIFLSSLKKKKIVTADMDGSNSTDLIGTGQYDYLAGFGMTVRGDTLYALGNGLTKKGNSSVLLLLNIKTKRLIERYSITIPPYGYLNDLAVRSSKDIFITDSESNKVFRIQPPNKNLEVFLDTPEVSHSNGIAISDDNSRLYLATQNGIRVIDIQTKKILNKPNQESSGIDGMKFYRNSLIGIVETGVVRFYLNGNGTEIESKSVIIPFDSTFKSPTTFDISGNAIYFIKNTQLNNFNDSTGDVIDKSKLESLILMKKRIE